MMFRPFGKNSMPKLALSELLLTTSGVTSCPLVKRNVSAVNMKDPLSNLMEHNPDSLEMLLESQLVLNLPESTSEMERLVAPDATAKLTTNALADQPVLRVSPADLDPMALMVWMVLLVFPDKIMPLRPMPLPDASTALEAHKDHLDRLADLDHVVSPDVMDAMA